MRLLGWDTSSKEGSVIALEWDPKARTGWQGVRMVCEWTLNLDLTHSDRLLWSIHQLLEAARWTVADIDLFAVGVGPGSFTGLRVGVTTARTLAHTLKKPLIGVSSLAALARPVALWLAQAQKRTVLITATDACKGELFALWGLARTLVDCVAMPEGDLHGVWKRGVQERAIDPNALIKSVRKKLLESPQTTQWALIGEASRRYPEAWANLPSAKRFEIPVAFPDQIQGRYLGLLAWEAYQAGCARDALRVYPRYARASDAELKLKAGLL